MKKSLQHIKKKQQQQKKLSKQIDFNNLTYYFKGKSAPRNFIGFKDPLGFLKKYKGRLYNTRKRRKTKKKLNQL